MTRRLVLVLIALSTVAGAAVSQPYQGTTSGETLLRSYMGSATPRDDPFLEGGDILDRQLARGFMDGIKDATEGTTWCYIGGKPHELNDDIAAELAKLPPAVLKGRAAPLVLAALRQRFPCPPPTTTRRTP